MSQRDYFNYLNADYGHDFGVWLCIEPVKTEIRFGDGFRKMSSPRGEGEWCKLKKDAKASYKADMARRRAERKACLRILF